MNTCTSCSSGQKLSVKLPAFKPDKRLAFVENVCAILIESRCGPDSGFVPINFGNAAETETDDIDAIFDWYANPRFAGPPAPANRRRPPAADDSQNGSRGVENEFIPPGSSPSPLARGSPSFDL